MFCCISCGHKVGYCFFILEIRPRSVFGARCTGFCAWNSGAPCLQQWNCLPRSQPEVFLVLCAQVSVPGTIVLCACNSGIACHLDFSFGSGVTFGPGRGKAGGCSVTPCQGVFLIRRVPSGLLSVPWNSGIRFRSDVWPGQRDGRRNVTPEPNEKIKVLAGNSTVPRHRKQARRHPSNQENTLAEGRQEAVPSRRARVLS